MPKIPRKTFRRSVKRARAGAGIVARIPRPPKGFAAPVKKYGLGRMYGIERKAYLPFAFSTTFGGTNVGTGFELSFSLAQVPAYAELQAVFDQYSIQKVKVTFMPRFSESSDVVAGSGPLGTLSSIFVCVDTDSTSFGTFYTAPGPVLERQGSLVRRTDKPFSMTIQPKSSTMVYKTAVTTGYGESPDGYNWLDCTDATIPHYGIRGWLDFPPRTGFTVGYDVLVDYHIIFKEVK